MANICVKILTQFKRQRMNRNGDVGYSASAVSNDDRVVKIVTDDEEVTKKMKTGSCFKLLGCNVKTSIDGATTYINISQVNKVKEGLSSFILNVKLNLHVQYNV